jgi:hypothetical protein
MTICYGAAGVFPSPVACENFKIILILSAALMSAVQAGM